MSGRKSAEVREAVALVTSGKVKTAYQAAKQTGVAESSIHRDPAYIAWLAASGSRKQWEPKQ